MTEDVKLGLLFFLFLAFVLLILLRITRQYHEVRKKIKYPLILIFILLTIWDVLFILSWNLPPAVERYFWAALYMTIAILIIRFALLLLFDFVLVRKKNYRVPRLLKEISGVVLFSIALIIILQDTLNIQVTTVVATSAVITVVLGLALQETLGNLFAGLALHLDPAYQVGDWIRAGEHTGKVEEITWRATKLRTVNNDFIVIPNGHIAKDTLTNYSFPVTPHAGRLHIAVSYGSPPNKVIGVIKEVLLKTDNVVNDPPPDIRLSSYQDFSMDYDIKFYYKDYGLIEPTLAAIRKALWYHFRRNDIEIPFPIRNIFVHDHAEELEKKEEEMLRLCRSLQKVYLFSSLEAEDRRLIASQLVPLFFADKEVIIREGDVGDSFFIIDEGVVEIFLTSVHGTRKVLNTLKEGDFFGEIALLTGERRSASVQAVGDVRVYQLKKDNFKHVLQREPEILDEIGSVLSRRKDQLVDLMSETSGPHEAMVLNTHEVKTRILGRIRNYFGL